MNTVEPIRDKNEIQAVKNELSKNGTRDLLLFTFGINSGLRVSDILKLKVKDVRNQTHITLSEEKTGKEKKFLINSAIKNILDSYITKMNDDDFLFSSREGKNKAITRQQAYNILNTACLRAGISAKEIGTHSMRKTFGYHHYQQFKDVVILQKIFNHSSPSVTLRYIGIDQDEIDESYNSINL